MSLCSVANFSEAHAYVTAIRGVKMEILVTGQGEFRAELTQIDLPRLRIRCGRENLARISHLRVPAGRGILFFISEPGRAAMHVGGRVLSADEIVVCAPNTTKHDWSAAACGWGFISFRTADLAVATRAIVGRELDLAAVTRMVHPDPMQKSRLMNLLQIAGRLAGRMPDVYTRRDFARGLEQELIHAMIMCLNDGTPVVESRGAHHHSEIIGRFETVLAANQGRPLYLAEICAATGVSERTLRVCCHDHLGIGPMQYLRLRRMHLARHALLLAEPTGATVTEIATDFGFCELGRFSVEYRALFGESPSTSLHRPPGGPTATPWLACLEHFQEKWTPVFRPKMRQRKNARAVSVSGLCETALDQASPKLRPIS
jgi:AraC-like DNA-binding protein